MAQSIIGALRVTLGMDSAAFTKGMKGAESRLAKFGKFAARGLLAVGAAAAAASGAMAVSVRGVLNDADQMAKAARKIGVPIEELARLRHAADLSGVSFGGLQNAIKRLSANMNDAKNGVGEAKDAFEELGVSVTNSDGSLKTASQILTELADIFKDMPDGAQKTALAMDLMGKSGADMIPMLNGGASALKAMMEEADSLGLVFTEEMATNAEQFNDNMDRLGKIFGSIGRQLAAELAPHLAEFSDWLVANAPQIVEFTKSLVDFGVTVVREITTIVQAVQSAWAAFESWWTGLIEWRNQIVTTVQGVAQDIVQAFAELPAKMLEIGGQIMQGLLDGVRAKAAEVKDYFVSLGADTAQWVRDALSIRSPSRVMMEIGQQVMQGLGNGMDGMRSHVMGIASSVSSTLANAFTGVITGAQSVEDALKNVLAQMASMITNKVFNYFLNAAFGGGGGGGLGGLFGGLFGGFRADGGPVTAGRSYIVGERGPELFMPSSSGTIVPSLSGASAGNDNVQINIINNSGAQVRQSRRRTANGQAIDVMIDDAVAGKISTPGSASRGALKSQFGLNSGLAKR